MTSKRIAELESLCREALVEEWRPDVRALVNVLSETVEEIKHLRYRPDGAIWQDLVAEIGRLQGELARLYVSLE